MPDDLKDATAKLDGTEKGWLPELRNNPFTRALGPFPSLPERYAVLDRPAEYDESERALSHDQRTYAVLRLFDLMVPVIFQVELAKKIHMILRQGYKSRDPSKGLHRAAFLASASAIAAFVKKKPVDTPDSAEPVVRIGGVPVAFALIGDPGMGKTEATNVILGAIKQTVVPETAYHVVQIIHLRIECPSSSGRRQFCLSGFTAFDELLGTNYAASFSNPRLSVEYLMLHLQHLMTLHAVGLLVVDEIQNLLTLKIGEPKAMMNFLRTIQNTLGVPVMVIGTNDARPLLSGSFSVARRAAGLGQPNWSRFVEGEAWDDWLKTVWGYQWTNVETPFTAEMSKIMYDEAQGILDIAMKLFILAQMLAISLGETKGLPEKLEPALLKQVAKDEFGSVAPMIAALRDGHEQVLKEIPDLKPLHQHVQDVISRTTGMPMDELQRLRDLRRLTAEAERDAKKAPFAAIRANFITRGHAADAVDRAIARALQSGMPADDQVGMIDAVRSALTVEAAPPDKSKKSGAGRRTAAKAPASPDPDSLAAAVEGAEDAHAALVSSGHVASPGEILAA